MKDTVVIVTGAGSGLGRAICVHAGRRGATVVAADIDLTTATETARLVREAGGVGEANQTDVADEAAVSAMVRAVKERYGRIDFIYNNAGAAQNGEFQDISPDGFRKVVDVNFWGVVHGSRAAYPIMTEQGYGTVANVTSLAGLIPGGLMTAYGAAKHAATGFTLNLRSEAKQYGVRVVAVCPGYLETPMHRSAENASDYLVSHDAEYLSKDHGYPTAEDIVAHLVRGVMRNRAVVVSPRMHRLFWWLYRIAPAVVPWAWHVIIRKIKAKEARRAAPGRPAT